MGAETFQGTPELQYCTMSRVCQVLVLFHKNGTGLKDQSLPILYSKSLLVTNLILFNIFIAKALSEGELANLAFQAANSATSIIQHDDIEMGDYNDVVNGRQPVVISHTGSEMGAMAAAVVPRSVNLSIFIGGALLTYLS